MNRTSFIKSLLISFITPIGVVKSFAEISDKLYQLEWVKEMKCLSVKSLDFEAASDYRQQEKKLMAELGIKEKKHLSTHPDILPYYIPGLIEKYNNFPPSGLRIQV